MVKSYRSHSQIIGKILKTIREGNATKTKIMYDSYLSYTQLKSYLYLLTEKGLIKENRKEMKFELTSKGADVISLTDSLNELV